MKEKKIFQNRKVVVLCAVISTLLWGSAFPCIKAGYRLFGIEAGDVGSQLLFAGIRFLLAGLLTLLLSLFLEKRGERQKVDRAQNRERGDFYKLVGGVLLLGLVQTGLQYIFYYIGMAHVSGVKGAILNGTSAFLCVLMARICYGKKETLSREKIVGCIVGLMGVILVNLGGSGTGAGEMFTGSFSLLGEGFMLISAVMVALGAWLSKEVSQKIKPVTLCGWQLLAGGLLLVIIGELAGGRVDWQCAGVTGIFLMGYMIFISAAAFALWTILLKYNRMGQVTVFQFLIPVFGTLLSAVFLNESIRNPVTLISLPLVCAGIYFVNRDTAAC